MTDRTTLNRAVHAAARKAGLDDDAYRDMLEAQTKPGQRSAKDCSEAELRKILAYLNGASSDRPFKASKNPLVRKIHAQWGELKRQGKLRDPSKKALRSFCARMAKTGAAATDPEFMTDAQRRVVVEALKVWIERGADHD